MAERDEFELPVQICEQSDDSIKYTYQSNKSPTNAQTRECCALIFSQD
jgi:hypothetical protein